MMGFTGEKIGMTQIYDQDGQVVPVTVVRIVPNQVTAVRTTEKNGYAAVQLGYTIPGHKPRLNKPEKGFFKKNNLEEANWLKEFRLDGVDVSFAPGAKLSIASFQVGDIVDVQGTSKGRGFQGVMKRWNFAGGRDSHGCSVSHRVPGSIGQRAYPGRVFPGKKMPGQMGNVQTTTKNLKVVGIELEQNLILIRGAVPGHRTARITVYPRSADFAKRLVSEATAS